MEDLEKNISELLEDDANTCGTADADSGELQVTELAEDTNEATESESAKENGEQSDSTMMGAFDYERLMKQDLSDLQSLFPHLRDKSSIMELDDPLRYASLRDLGLSPKEAYLATARIDSGYDNRSHITPTISRTSGASGSSLSAKELEEARFIFSDLSDREIQKLYKKVTK